MAKRKFERKLVHVYQDAVTHQLVREVRDGAWWAAERAAGAVEEVGRVAPTNAFMGPLTDAVREARLLLVAIECGDFDPAGWLVLALPYRTVAWEYGQLDPSEQPRFSGRVWEKLRRLERHTDAAVVARIKPTEAA